MSSWRPTVHNQHDEWGLPAYEIRGSVIYPTIHNERHEWGMPVYEIS